MIDAWISVEEELPDCDGMYYICNNPENIKDMSGNYCIHLSTAEYDGYGFKYEGHYLSNFVKYWMRIFPVKKRYGKINEQ